jgi:hypothetical protein
MYGILYQPGQPSAAVTAYEESTKDAFAATELADAAVATVSPYTILFYRAVSQWADEMVGH